LLPTCYTVFTVDLFLKYQTFCFLCSQCQTRNGKFLFYCGLAAAIGVMSEPNSFACSVTACPNIQSLATDRLKLTADFAIHFFASPGVSYTCRTRCVSSYTLLIEQSECFGS
jgi:hypothetical protein